MTHLEFIKAMQLKASEVWVHDFSDFIVVTQRGSGRVFIVVGKTSGAINYDKSVYWSMPKVYQEYFINVIDKLALTSQEDREHIPWGVGYNW